LYEELCDRLREVERLNSVQNLLFWDEQVMMPAGASKARGLQKAALAGVLHEKKVDRTLGDILE
ncbi:unnamed protein product, partial [Choristocarpus tenellus]